MWWVVWSHKPTSDLWVCVPLTYMTTAFHHPLWSSLYARFWVDSSENNRKFTWFLYCNLIGTTRFSVQEINNLSCNVTWLSPLYILWGEGLGPTGVLWNTNNLCYAHINPGYQRGSSLLNCNLYVHHLEYSPMSSSYAIRLVWLKDLWRDQTSVISFNSSKSYVTYPNTLGGLSDFLIAFLIYGTQAWE